MLINLIFWFLLCVNLAIVAINLKVVLDEEPKWYNYGLIAANGIAFLVAISFSSHFL